MVNQIIAMVDEGNNFIVKGGAGSGKTYTLIETIENLLGLKKRIALITYTNAAKEEIIERLKKSNKQVDFCGTIHQFAWQIISNYNIELNTAYRTLFPNSVTEGVSYKFIYDYGFSRIDEERRIIKLSHDKVISVFSEVLNSYSTLYKILAAMYDCILVDEYQDTSQEVVDKLTSTLFESSVGFFGDPIQSIYSETSLNLHDTPILQKPDNWRSSQKLVDFFNEIRSEINEDVLAQRSFNPEINQIESKMLYYEVETMNKDVLNKIETDNDLSIDKALFVTHNLGISNEVQPDNEYNTQFRNNQRKFTDDKNELYEHLVFLYDLNEMKQGKIFETKFIEEYCKARVNRLSDIVEWQEKVTSLKSAITIEEIISSAIYSDLNEKLQEDLSRLNNQMEIRYFDSMYEYSQKDNKYKTMFSMKGLEADTILVYLNNGRWNRYNFNRLNPRTKKLLYVALTRAKKNLIIVANANINQSLKEIIESHFEMKQLN